MLITIKVYHNIYENYTCSENSPNFSESSSFSSQKHDIFASKLLYHVLQFYLKTRSIVYSYLQNKAFRDNENFESMGQLNKKLRPKN